jgi:putative transcriptional regulator
MRMDRDRSFKPVNGAHAGSLLLAHPNLLDPNFRRSVILLSAHAAEEGSIGVVVNRPSGKTLGEYDPELSESSLAGVPLFFGGPVATEQLILAAWKWCADEGSFKLYFGIDGEKAKSLQAADSEYQLRGFLGHAGWSEGQLDEELDQGSWVLSGCLPILKSEPGKIDWHELLCQERSELRLLADAPDDPSLN